VGVSLTSPTLPAHANGRIDIGRIRREQIVAAAADIIVRQGLHNLSLSKIERSAGMKRGQLTYYFPTKEEILLAVFDRLLLLMYRRLEEAEGASHEERVREHSCWECVQRMLQTVLIGPPFGAEFHALQYTFLAQIAHRDDFRQRLASLYEEWRGGLAAHWRSTDGESASPEGGVSPRALASLVQAMMHGLLVQLAVDPNAFDRAEMLALCVRVLAPLFAPPRRRVGTPRRAGGPP
jgi:AcrR family transcriptional regulator